MQQLRTIFRLYRGVNSCFSCTNFYENSSAATTFFGHLLYPFRFPNRIRRVVIKGKVSSMAWSEQFLIMHQFSGNTSAAITFFGHLLCLFRFPNRIRNVAIKGKVSFMPCSEQLLFMHQLSRKLISLNDVHWMSPLVTSFSKSGKKCSN